MLQYYHCIIEVFDSARLVSLATPSSMKIEAAELAIVKVVFFNQCVGVWVECCVNCD